MRPLNALLAYLSTESSKTAFYWALTVFAAGSIGHINGLFFNDLFSARLKITDGWFLASNVVFAIVDPLNDVLLGWYIDRHHNARSGPTRRLDAARLGGTLWCLVYLFPYLLADSVKDNPTLIGLLYLFSRSAFDTALTLTWVALGALIADVAVNHEDRVKCQHFASIGGLFSLPLPNIAYRLWAGSENGGMARFKNFVIAQSILGILGFQWTTRKLQARMEKIKATQASPPDPPAEDLVRLGLDKEPASIATEELLESHRRLTIGEYARQISTQKNLFSFLLVNVPQEFLYAFTSTFFTAFIDGLLRHRYSVPTNAMIVSYASFPINVILYPFVHFIGTYRVWRGAILLKVLLCLFTYLAGPDNALAVAFFLVAFSLLQASMGGQFSLIMADLTDEDQARYHRPENQAARFMATNALFCKPTGALSPVLGRWMLGDYTPETAGLDPGFRERCFRMMTIVPLVVGLWQMVWWERYGLKGEALEIVKRKVADVREAFTVRR